MKIDLKKISSKIIYEGKFQKVSKNTYELPNGKFKEYDVINNKLSAVGIIALTSDKKIILVEQYRPNFETIMLEIPAGMIENDENYFEAGIRELQEETGYLTKEIKDFGKYKVSKDKYIYLCICENLENKVMTSLDVDEFINIHEVPLNKLDEFIKNYTLDIKTLYALELLKNYDK